MQCQNKKNWIPATGSAEIVWLSCGHYEHLQCWQRRLAAGQIKNCNICDAPFVVVLSRKRIKPGNTKAVLDRHAQQLLKELRNKPQQLVGKALRDYSALQPDYDQFMEPNELDQFLKLDYWTQLSQHNSFSTKTIREWLISAIEANRLEQIQQIIKGIEIKNICLAPGKYSCLHYAAIYGCGEVISLLAGQGHLLDPVNGYRLTPLHYACRYGHLDAVKALIKAGANPDLQDRDGKTPLHTAIEGLHVDVTGYLILIGAKTNIQDEQELTAIDLPKELGDKMTTDIDKLAQIEKMLRLKAHLFLTIDANVLQDAKACERSRIPNLLLQELTGSRSTDRTVLCNQAIDKLQNNNCLICDDDVVISGEIVLTSHGLSHVDCITEYLKIESNCPICNLLFVFF